MRSRREREADQAARALRHEVDDLGRDQLGRADEIAFVLAIFVVGNNEHLTVADRLDRLTPPSQIASSL